MLEKGQIAPEIASTDQDNQLVSLADFKDKRNLVLYFYPKDDTPGCTVEADQFTARIEEFDRLDTVVLGVSKDSCESHRAFIGKFGLKVGLLSDTTGELCARYGVWQVKEKNGEKKMGIVRSTFIIDKQGRLAEVEYNVTADGHAQAVLERIKAL